MKKFLLPNKPQYKANLHCHSTLSDGKYTPEQLKANYKAAGYSILAYSDHNKLVPHTDLKDADFLPITATEIDMTEYNPVWANARTYHINFFSSDENRTEFIPVQRAYDYEVANDMIKRAADAGFVAQYNHPRWSWQVASDFTPLKGCKLFEVFNTGCEKEMANGYGNYEYEIMLKAGEPVLPSATDDNHNVCGDPASPFDDSFGGWDMMYMDKLEYGEFFKAVEQGAMYASTGPAFKELSYENGVIHLECSPCYQVLLRTESRYTRVVNAHGDTITSADFNLDFGYDWDFVRVELHDAKGMAFSRAFKHKEF